MSILHLQNVIRRYQPFKIIIKFIFINIYFVKKKKLLIFLNLKKYLKKLKKKNLRFFSKIYFKIIFNKFILFF